MKTALTSNPAAPAWALEPIASWFQSNLHRILLFTSIALATASGVVQDRLDWTFAVEPIAAGGAAPIFQTVLDMHDPDGVMHAPHIALAATTARVLWFQGSREAVGDVEIWAADMAIGGSQFDPAFKMFDARAMTKAMVPRQPVLVLGNTIQQQPGSLNRYLATVVSAGGWAAASLARLDYRNGQVLHARKIPLSPFLNRSNLVRGGAVQFGDGDIGIPAYHELVAGFGLLVRLDPMGRVRKTARIGFGKSGIQPELVVTGPNTAVAFLRPFDRPGQLYRSETLDGGQSWSLPHAVTGLGNPNAPVAALLLSDGRILMAANTDPNSDKSLSLLVSADQGRSWTTLVTLEDFGTKKRSAVRYPDMARLSNGKILLTYSTFAKHGIRALLFNDAWVNSRG